MDDKTLQFQWRGMDLTLSYDFRLWGRGNDRFFIEAIEPFHKGGDDYLCQWLPSVEAPRSNEQVISLARMWLDEWLERCAKMREADVIRSQLKLF